MGKFEITQAQYQQIAGINPSYFKGPNNPVETVSWHDTMRFCAKLSERTGKQFILPTEAQWEYACRAGSQTRFHFGDSDRSLGEYAWYGLNSAKTTHAVGQKKPNAFNLYDMHGNVWEWTLSLYEEYPYSDSDGRNNPSASAARVLRGGCWDYYQYCRSAFRYWNDPSTSFDYFGFRVVVSVSSR